MKNAPSYIPPKIGLSTISAPDSLQALEDLPDRLALEFRKSFFIMVEIYESDAETKQTSKNRKAAMKNDVNKRFERVHARIDSLGQEHQQTRQTAQEAKNTADSAQSVADRALKVAGQAKQEAESSTEFAGFFGVGGQYFAGETAGFVQGGLQAGDFELFGSYNARPNIGSIDLPKLGNTQVGRSGYRVGVAWYPIESDRYAIGPQAAFEHGENYLKGREEFLTVYESTQLGAAANVQIWKDLHMHGSVAYAVTNSAESSDLNLERTNSRIRAGVSLRWHF
jgi:hypothetical protein